jgi:tetratricopeptide (TPR) repeat protein
MPPMQILGRAQRSLEEALQDPELRSSVEELLPEIDILYARLLALELKMILWAEGPDNVPLVVRSDYEKGTCLDIFSQGPHILARKRIERILGPKSLQSIGSIGSWKDQSLINTKSHFSKNYKGETSSTEELSGYTGLITEAKRFAEWAEQNGSSTDLLDTILELEEKISARKEEDLPVAAAPSIVEKREPGEKVKAAAGAAVPASSASITSEMPRPTAEPAKPTRKWGCVLTTCGSLILAVSLIMLAAIAAFLLDPDSVGDDPEVVIARSAICILPIFLIGLVLLLFGISKLRSQRKQSAATQFGGYRTKTEREAWAQAMVGAEFIDEGNYNDALAISEQALAKSPRCKEAWVVKGGALALMNRSEEALACYEQALAIDPSYEEASTQKAMLLQSL